MEQFRIGTQGETMLNGELEAMVNSLKTISEESIDRELIITGIDSAMNGNPYLTHKLLNSK